MLLVSTGLLSDVRGGKELEVTTDFPSGGSVEAQVSEGSSQEINLKTSGGWWALRVENCDPGRPLAIAVETSRPQQQHPFVFQRSNGEWGLLHEGRPLNPVGTKFLYTAPDPAESCVVARYAPYFLPEAASRIEEVSQKLEGAEKIDLGPSRGGHPVPGIRIRFPGVPDDERIGVWIQARQHAWEITGSWATDGLLSWLAGKSPEALDLLRRTEMVIIPVFEPDGVEEGKGWMSDPNPNRTWLIDRESEYPQVERAKAAIQELAGKGRGIGVFIDMHCYTVTSEGDASDWSHWATWYQGEEPDQRAIDTLALAGTAVAGVPAGDFTIHIPETYNTAYAGAGPSSAPQMAALWVRSQAPDAWCTTLEHSIFSRTRLDAGHPCPVPDDHTARGPLIGQTILAYLDSSPSNPRIP